MNATELETAITAAEKDAGLVRALFNDLKAYKDEQLSDLTSRVNAAEKAQTEAESARSAAEVKAEEAAAQLVSQKQAGDIALEQTKTNAAEELAKALRESAESMDTRVKLDDDALAAVQKIAETRMESLVTVSKERDDLAAQLAALKDGQTKLATIFVGKNVNARAKLEAAQEAVASAIDSLDESADVLADAMRPSEEKAKAAAAARKAALLAEAAAIPD